MVDQPLKSPFPKRARELCSGNISTKQVHQKFLLVIGCETMGLK